MLKMLIVDDEKTIRKGIQTVIQWSAYGISVVGEAKNGQEGLDLVRTKSPDILLTDIKMPLMDGLELIRHVRDERPGTKIVILSGHDDFAYAKEALHLGVKEYILKPFGASELTDLILKLKDEILNERDSRNIQLRRQTLIKENQLQLISRLVQTIVSGDFSDIEELHEKAKLLNSPLNGPLYRSVILSVDNLSRKKDPRELIKIKQIICSTASEQLDNSGLFALSDFNQIIGILNVNDESEAALIHQFEELISSLLNSLDLSLSVGVGKLTYTLEELFESFGTALTAVSQRVYRGKGKVHMYKEHMSHENGMLQIPSSMEKNILTSLLNSDYAELKGSLFTIVNTMKRELVPVSEIRNFAFRLVLMSAFVLEEGGIEGREKLEQDLVIFEKIQNSETIDGIHHNLLSHFKKLIRDLKEENGLKYKQIVCQTISRIKKNYAGGISLKDIADELSVTANYLSRIFKEETGRNFNDWLNSYRIEQAKKLLKEDSLKTYQIAEETGFSDYKYFHQIFKKYSGMSPREYKNGGNGHLESNEH